MSNEIRVRFAPSPTGYLHIGGLRTALYDYLYAKKVNGKFVLRIEDTDQRRYVDGAVENLIRSLNQVKLTYDEGPNVGGDVGPYFQSKRLDIYQNYVKKLINEGVAYPCFCSEERIEKVRQKQRENGEDVKYDGKCRSLDKETVLSRIKNGEDHVIRLKIPQEGEITFYDVVRDKVTIPWKQIDDQVLIKSDGFPTYHLACVVDDHLMRISHVIRGEEWLSSTPKHIFLYQAFGWKPPKWVHLPLILNPDRSKLSKRQGDVATEDYLKKGFLPEAILNFIALLGWHAPGNKELFTMDELIKAFSFKRISKSGAVFDIEKLKWMNSHYLKTLDLNYITEKAIPFLKKADIDTDDSGKMKEMIIFARERVSTLSEIPGVLEPFFNELNYSDDNLNILQTKDSQNLLRFWYDKICKSDLIEDNQIQSWLKESIKELRIKGKNLYFPLRLAFWGECHGPEIPVLLKILGKDQALKRLQNCLIEEV